MWEIRFGRGCLGLLLFGFLGVVRLLLLAELVQDIIILPLSYKREFILNRNPRGNLPVALFNVITMMRNRYGSLFLFLISMLSRLLGMSILDVMVKPYSRRVLPSYVSILIHPQRQAIRTWC
jgi:hypothetical protein